MIQIRLTATSHVVLGLVALRGRATPYDLKREVAATIGYVWSFPHAQLYTEPGRLASAGLLQEQRERGGRNRRYFTITSAGRSELERWLCSTVSRPIEFRDLALLKLFFADLIDGHTLARLAESELGVHRARLEFFQLQAKGLGKEISAPRLGPLRTGLKVEEMMIDFWHQIAQADTRARKRPARVVKRPR